GLLDAWAEAGVNRLSMGAQSFVPAELAALGRLHDAERPGQAFALARAHGFQRLSLDLMFGYPGHTAASWAHTLAATLALAPGHVAAYGFPPGGGPPRGAAVPRGGAGVAAPEGEAELSAQAEQAFAGAGLAPYEPSNWARRGAECRHNLTYWLRR